MQSNEHTYPLPMDNENLYAKPKWQHNYFRGGPWYPGWYYYHLAECFLFTCQQMEQFALTTHFPMVFPGANWNWMEWWLWKVFHYRRETSSDMPFDRRQLDSWFKIDLLDMSVVISNLRSSVFVQQNRLPFRWISIVLVCTQSRVRVFVWNSQSRFIQRIQARTRWWYKIAHA